MKVERIEVFLRSEKLVREFWMSLAPIPGAMEIIVRLTTDDGVVGIAQCHGMPQEPVAEILTKAMPAIVIGRDPFDYERIWDEMFTLCHYPGWKTKGWSRASIMTAIAGIDIALWDLMGKATGKSVAKLLGSYRDELPAYATGGYYEDGKDIAGLVDEVGVYVDEDGYDAVKLKVGREVGEDLRRVEAVRNAYPEIDIMLDANQGWDVPTAIAAAKGLELMDIRWYEEPVHWYDQVEGLRRIVENTTLPVASGEQEMTRHMCRDMIERSGVRIMQFDATKAGGITEWRKVAAHAEMHDVMMAPHHDPQIHIHCVAGVRNGLILESFPNPDRDPAWQDMYVGVEPIVNSRMTVPQGPGLGYDLNWELVERICSRHAGEPV
ncbi:MAG: mandelate racemase/muconate lactonizing enzyme family protein [Chloroflexota bacterium]|jgi:L-alanine-DL-glutamate epimerase-like enolase superfamily enzyme|nr:mandelate racemase/muconate lactonizing enzyme family protein [Chloroflexota bacterium]MDP6509473.1 mandelate racemase/muconate lactonizing enzyme family protein [Chloroflexota bacterium]MDP6757249.1 mandelate racemase/muconate lactonizing enzyme family protein [Chloroflexota bacterium]